MKPGDMLSFEQFQEVELRVGRIIAAERVAESIKLLKLDVELGGEIRQIIAGIGGRYEPDGLVGTEIVLVANLAPRMILGLESQGMLLAASTDTGPVLLRPDAPVASGVLVR